jgi:hypothetical protein
MVGVMRILPLCAVLLVLVMLAPYVPSVCGAAELSENEGTSGGRKTFGVYTQATDEAAQTQFSVVITFNEFPIGTQISDQYKPQGILFFGNSPFITDDPDVSTSPVLSGTPEFQGAIEGIFVNPADGNARIVNGFQLSAGEFNSIGSVELTWFDLSGKVLGAKRNSQTSIETFTIAQGGIAQWRIAIVADEP